MVSVKTCCCPGLMGRASEMMLAIFVGHHAPMNKS
jgi:hypothetical protein